MGEPMEDQQEFAIADRPYVHIQMGISPKNVTIGIGKKIWIWI
jgi:hypothetical protein